MTAEIISVGTELLLGTIVNTNAAFLSRKLADLGIAIYSQSTVGDNHERLMAGIKHAFGKDEKTDIVIISGGLGPTQDDITKDVAAKYFNRGLVMHEESLDRIKIRFADQERKLGNESRNALIPENADVLPNDNGLAPGIIIEESGKILILLPGPPHELEPMFTKYAIPFLSKKTDRVFVSRTLKIIGLGELAVETKIQDLISAQTNPTIAPYAKVGEVHIRLTASAADTASAEKLIAPIAEEIYSRLSLNILTPRQSFALQNFATPLGKGVTPPSQANSLIGGVIYGEDETTLESAVIARIKALNQTLATAESCTGGMIASTLISAPGSSAVFNEGLITYSNESKIARLNISPEIIKTYGAVSPQTAAAMAEGAAKSAKASIGLSTTGIAGPGGGTPEKPVGLVYIGVYVNGQAKTVSHKLKGDRNEIRIRATKLALHMLLQEICNVCS